MNHLPFPHASKTGVQTLGLELENGGMTPPPTPIHNFKSCTVCKMHKQFLTVYQHFFYMEE